MNTRRKSWGAVIAVTTLALAPLAACGSGGDSEEVASTSTPMASVSSAPSTTSAAPTTSGTEAPSAADAARDSKAGTPAPDSKRTSQQQPQRSAPNSTSEKADKTSLPTNPGDYSEALMQAWNSGNTVSMKLYATDAVVAQLASTKVDGALLRTACEDNMCSYTTESGTRVTLTLDTTKVDAGSSQAVTAVKIARD